MNKPILPEDSAERKGIPLVTGLLDYFPAALAEVAKVSVAGNEKHNPGQPLHWSRGKSNDHADCVARHLAERGGFDKEGIRHSAEGAWRYLALLQEELEAAGAPPSRASRFAVPVQPLGLAEVSKRLVEAEKRQANEVARIFWNTPMTPEPLPWYRRAWECVLDYVDLFRTIFR